MPITSRCHRWRKSFSFRPRKDTAVAPGISSAFEWLANLPPHRIADRRAAVCQSVKCHEGNAQLGLWIYGISTAHLHLLHAIFIIYARPVGGGGLFKMEEEAANRRADMTRFPLMSESKCPSCHPIGAAFPLFIRCQSFSFACQIFHSCCTHFRWSFAFSI